MIEDLDRAPKELIAALRPILEGKPVHVSTHRPPLQMADGFKLFVTATSAGSLSIDSPHEIEEVKEAFSFDPDSHGACERLLLPQSLHGTSRLFLPMSTRPLDPESGEIEILIKRLSPTLSDSCVQLLLKSFRSLEEIASGAVAASLDLSNSLVVTSSIHTRPPTVRDLLKVCRRLSLNQLIVEGGQGEFLPSSVKEAIVCEIVDVMVVGSASESFIQQTARGLGTSSPPPQQVSPPHIAVRM